MTAWVVEGNDEKGTWWVGHSKCRAKALETAFRFTDKAIAEKYARRINAKVFEVLY